jgi:acyl carrier protein
MTNSDLYIKAFTDSFDISEDEAKEAKYQEIVAWDSVGHMVLVAAIEEAFDVMLDTEDIIDFSSFDRGQDILKKYDVAI